MSERNPTPLPDPGPRPAFDPARYLTRVNGADYLEVKWRLVWLRDRHPDAEIETVAVRLEPDWAVFKAVIRLPTGGLATGYGSESAGDFRDYVEKAETKAIGRALAALGFGTQFCPDMEFGAAAGRVVDAPGRVSRMRRDPGVDARGAPPGARGAGEPATQRQLRYLETVAREAGLDAAALDDRATQEFGVPVARLARRDASALIDLLTP